MKSKLTANCSFRAKMVEQQVHELKCMALYFLKGKQYHTHLKISKDELVQDLIAHAYHTLNKYDESKGTIYTYLLTVFKNYVAIQWNHKNRAKRKYIAVRIDESFEANINNTPVDRVSFDEWTKSKVVNYLNDEEFICYVIAYWKLNLNRYVKRNTMQGKACIKIIQALSGEIKMKSYKSFIKELNLSRAMFSLLMIKMRAVNKRLLKQYYQI